jgi:hypothetical protein
MSRYINNLNKKLDILLSKFKDDIVSTEHNPYNQSGYAYLASGRCNTHLLKDGSYIKEGLSFSSSKAATMPYFCHYSKDKELISSHFK